MPGRVKCLHVHVAHALAVGPGVNPFGDETLSCLAERMAVGRLRNRQLKRQVHTSERHTREDCSCHVCRRSDGYDLTRD